MQGLASAVWRKSAHSGANGCVEVAFLEDRVAVRDSKQQHPAVLVFTLAEWQAFLNGVRDGEFDWPQGGSLAHRTVTGLQSEAGRELLGPGPAMASGDVA